MVFPENLLHPWMMNPSLDQLAQELLGLRQRLERLEENAGISRNPVPPQRGPAPQPLPAREPVRPRAPEENGAEWSRLLAVVAVICFVLAGAFLIRLAIQSGWLTPLRQWAVVVLLGSALVTAGRYLPGVDRSYRGYLSAAGSIVLYFAAFSSSLYFEVTPALLSVILGAFVTALNLALFVHHRSEIFPLVAAVGTYITPLLFKSADFDPIHVSAFFLLWSGLFSWFSSHFHTRILTLISAYLGIGVYAGLFLATRSPEQLGLVLGVLAGQFLLLALGVYRQSLVSGLGLSRGLAWSFFPVICFYYGVTYHFLNRITPELTPWIALAFAGMLLLLHRSAARILGSEHVQGSSEVVHAFLSVVLFQAGYLELLPEAAKSWILPLWIIGKYLSEDSRGFPRLSGAVQVLGLLLGGVEFLKTCWELISDPDLSSLPVALATLVLGGIYYLKKLAPASEVLESEARDKETMPTLFLGMAHVLSILSLYRLAHDWGSLAVSLVWMSYAGAVLGLGYTRRNSALARSSLAVLMVATLKALVYDASITTPLIRILCLLLTGGVLYGAGVLFQRMSKWSPRSRPQR